MTLAILFHFLCAQHVSHINIIHHQELATILLNYYIGRIVLGLMCVGVSVWLEWYPCCRMKHNLCFTLQHGYHSNPTAPKAPDDGYINVRNMLNT